MSKKIGILFILMAFLTIPNMELKANVESLTCEYRNISYYANSDEATKASDTCRLVLKYNDYPTLICDKTDVRATKKMLSMLGESATCPETLNYTFARPAGFTLPTLFFSLTGETEVEFPQDMSIVKLPLNRKTTQKPEAKLKDEAGNSINICKDLDSKVKTNYDNEIKKFTSSFRSDITDKTEESYNSQVDKLTSKVDTKAIFQDLMNDYNEIVKKVNDSNTIIVNIKNGSIAKHEKENNCKFELGESKYLIDHDKIFAEYTAKANLFLAELKRVFPDEEKNIDKLIVEVERTKEQLTKDFTAKDITVNQIEATCSNIFSKSLDEQILKIWGWIQIIAPIMLIFFGTMDFGKAVLSEDQDALKKSTSKFIKRAIATVAVFFVPLIVQIIFSVLNFATKGTANEINAKLCMFSSEENS